MKFSVDKITDRKRVVRGEHYQMARMYLRRRDAVHHRDWTFLITCGGNPEEEISCIRELFPKAKITAVDIVPEFVEKAKQLGAESILGNLEDYKVETTYNIKYLPPTFLGKRRFDVVNLDMCGNVGPNLKKLFSVLRGAVLPGGIFMTTCSYGRDVAELYSDLHPFYAEKETIPEALKLRLSYLFPSSFVPASVMWYKGEQMPMFSCLFSSREKTLKSAVQVGDGDFEKVVTEPFDPCKVYSCPQERLEFIRRSLSARKAVETRKVKLAARDLFQTT